VKPRTVLELSRDGQQKFVFHRLANGMALNHSGDRDAKRRCPVCSRNQKP
jgi:hypothetical protein